MRSNYSLYGTYNKNTAKELSRFFFKKVIQNLFYYKIILHIQFTIPLGKYSLCNPNPLTLDVLTTQPPTYTYLYRRGTT